MTIISKESLDFIKGRHITAIKGGLSYEAAYHQALLGLEAAITLLAQIEHTTQGLSIETKITLSKD